MNPATESMALLREVLAFQLSREGWGKPTTDAHGIHWTGPHRAEVRLAWRHIGVVSPEGQERTWAWPRGNDENYRLRNVLLPLDVDRWCAAILTHVKLAPLRIEQAPTVRQWRMSAPPVEAAR